MLHCRLLFFAHTFNRFVIFDLNEYQILTQNFLLIQYFFMNKKQSYIQVTRFERVHRIFGDAFKIDDENMIQHSWRQPFLSGFIAVQESINKIT